MKYFLAYRFTGEDPKKLDGIIRGVCNSIESAGHNYFCSFFENDFYKKNNYFHKQILYYALKELDKCDIYLALIRSADKSEGMLLEAGYALAKGKTFYLAINKGVNTTFMKEIADKVIEFDNIEDLCHKLSKI